MMGLRQNPSAAILAHEWSYLTADVKKTRRTAGVLDGQIVELYLDFFSIEAPQYDETVGSVSAQVLGPDCSAISFWPSPCCCKRVRARAAVRTHANDCAATGGVLPSRRRARCWVLVGRTEYPNRPISWMCALLRPSQRV